MVLAGEHPEQKPAPGVFRVACEALGVTEAQAVMVGDNYKTDIAGPDLVCNRPKGRFRL